MTTEQWTVIYKTDNEYAAEILKQGLIESGIAAVVMNKKISAYNLGMVEVWVNPEDKASADAYLKENQI